MLTIYRRHRKGCKIKQEAEIRIHIENDVFFRKGEKKCSCALWVDGPEIRQSLHTCDWDKAREEVGKLVGKQNPEAASAAEPITLEQAMGDFLSDARSRKLKNSTIDRYRILFRQLGQFARGQGIRYLKELDTPTLRHFRASWKDGDLAGLKKLERLRCFFRFVQENQWLSSNPAAALKNPRVVQRPTLSFSQEEMIRIIAAANEMIRTVRSDGRDRARRVRALVLLLRYTGLRISDAVGCPIDRLQDGKLWLYTHKTGQPVYCPVPEFVAQELEAIPRVSERYWFWSGKGTVETARKKWSESLAAVFKQAGVEDGHAHRFRDTFAVELLLSGTPIENVSAFLGHASIRVTERHYAPWVRARQERAELDVQRSWSQDRVVLMETSGTPEVHEENRRPN
jgi:site-specific recombinase XerD